MTKKFFIALVCMASMLLAACTPGGGGGGVDPTKVDPSTLDNTTKKCWEITRKIGTVSETGYMWGTEYEVVVAMQATDKIAGGIGSWSYKANSAKDQNSCEGQNPDYVPSECWKVTLSNGFQSMVNYIWSDEEGVKEFIAMYEKTGWTATYAKSDAKDEDACEKKNDNPEEPDPVNPEEKDYSKYDNTTEKCWEVTASYGVMSVTEYVWMTERQLVQAYDAIVGATFSYKEAAATDEDSCEALGNGDPENPDPENPDPENPDPENPQGDNACWMISSTYMGYTTISYQWSSEEQAKAIVEAAAEIGATATYQKADAADENACDALNEDNPGVPQTGNEKCWQITMSFMGMSETEYMWLDEEYVKAVVAGLEETLTAQGMVGATVTYKQASANDADSCEALNAE